MIPDDFGSFAYGFITAYVLAVGTMWLLRPRRHHQIPRYPKLANVPHPRDQAMYEALRPQQEQM
jgi:hypothetical protein